MPSNRKPQAKVSRDKAPAASPMVAVRAKASTLAESGRLVPPSIGNCPWNSATIVSMVKSGSTTQAVRLTGSSILTALKAQLGVSSVGTGATADGLALRILEQDIWVPNLTGSAIDVAATWFSLITYDDDQSGSAIPAILSTQEAISPGPYPACVRYKFPPLHRQSILVEKNKMFPAAAIVDIYTNRANVGFCVYTKVLWRSEDGQAIPSPADAVLVPLNRQLARRAAVADWFGGDGGSSCSINSPFTSLG